MHATVTSKLKAATFLTLCFDGWSRAQGSDHLLGFTAATCGMAVFLDFKNTTDRKITSAYMLEQMDLVMQKHGILDKVAGIVTDTPCSMQGLWRAIEEKYPQIVAMGAGRTF
eukprot:347533-Chlamydomonas_euryale.AAC.1